MGVMPLWRVVTVILVVSVLAAPLPGSAQDARDTVIADLVVVAPASGPAWWKVSKGDASVWIIGLPPKTPRGTQWDQTTLKRRLKGARLMLGAYVEASGFRRRGGGVRRTSGMGAYVEASGRPQRSGGLPGLSGVIASRVDAEYRRLGGRSLSGRPNIKNAIDLHWTYHSMAGVSFDTHDEIYDVAREAGVTFVTPPVYTHNWSTREINQNNPEMMRCIEAIFREIHEPPELFYQAAEYWAVGDVVNMLAVTPKGTGRDCELLWRGHWERTVAFQTALIAQALDRPGKVVAAAHIDQLVAKDGILERLRAQGFTIHDPSKPLEE